MSANLDKPKREDFPNQEEFEETVGFWNSHQRRILALRQQYPQLEQEQDPMKEAVDFLEMRLQELTSQNSKQS